MLTAGRRTGAPGNMRDQIVDALLRPIFRPLSRKGLIRRAGLLIRRESADRAAVDILTDPKKLEVFMNLKFQKPGSQRAANMLGQIGAIVLFDLPVERRTGTGE